MTNPAEQAYRVSSSITKFYTRLLIAKDIINDAIDEFPKAISAVQEVRIQELRDKLNREIAEVLDLSRCEAHRICNQPQDDDITVREQHAIEWLFSPEAGQYKVCEARAIIRERFGPHVDELLQKKFA